MTDTTSTTGTGLTIIPIETPTLGDRSYLIHDGEVAFVVDPQRDIDRVLYLLTKYDVRLTHVLETHIHNDYVTGGLALDLLGHEHTHELVRAQHASAHRLAEELPDAAEVFPTHGFGSFCSATQSDATSSTIGQERGSNPVLTQDEETYVRDLLAGLAAYPAYYAHMAPANAAGPGEADLTAPHQADPVELRRRIEDGEWIVDLRNRTVFAAGHVPGSLNFGIDGGFATYLGWLIEWGTPLTLLGETPDQVAVAQRELVRIGIDRPAAAATGTPSDWVAGTGVELATFGTATFADLAQVRHHRQVTVLDVRRADEYTSARIDGAVNIPLHELPTRLADVPTGEVWVHCAGGYRASVAASFLSAAGLPLVAIDDAFANAEEVGLHLIGPEAPDAPDAS